MREAPPIGRVQARPAAEVRPLVGMAPVSPTADPLRVGTVRPGMVGPPAGMALRSAMAQLRVGTVQLPAAMAPRSAMAGLPARGLRAGTAPLLAETGPRRAGMVQHRSVTAGPPAPAALAMVPRAVTVLPRGMVPRAVPPHVMGLRVETARPREMALPSAVVRRLVAVLLLAAGVRSVPGVRHRATIGGRRAMRTRVLATTTRSSPKRSKPSSSTRSLGVNCAPSARTTPTGWHATSSWRAG